MASKLEHLERTILELGTEIFRVKHKIELIEKENHAFGDIMVSLRKLLDEKNFITLEEFDEAVALDKILAKQAHSHAELGSDALTDIKKTVN